MKINGQTISAQSFAYDGCHKIYLIEDENDRNEAIGFGYEIHPIDALPETYERSCSMRFISTWKLETIVPQCCYKVTFTND